jgi:hypothetical protein
LFPENSRGNVLMMKKGDRYAGLASKRSLKDSLVFGKTLFSKATLLTRNSTYSGTQAKGIIPSNKYQRIGTFSSPGSHVIFISKPYITE